MWDDLRDRLDIVILVNVSADEEDKLRKGNETSICLSYDSKARDDRDPVRSDAGFRSLDDFQMASKRADLIFFGSSAPRVVMSSVIQQFLQSDGKTWLPPPRSITARGASAREAVRGMLTDLDIHRIVEY
jgi:hypothetical protein